MSSKHDRELQTQVILNHVKSGLTVKDACALAGVGQRTFYTWRRERPAISAALKKAETEAKSFHIRNIREHSCQDWKASAWYLERKYPNEWGKRMVVVEPPKEAESGILVRVPSPKKSKDNALPPE